MKIETAIFDMDGTLLDSERLIQRAWQISAQEIGEFISEREFLKLLGTNDQDSLDILEESWKRAFDKKSFLERAEHHHYAIIEKEGIQIREGIEALIRLFNDFEIPIGVATSTHRRQATLKLQVTGLIDEFSVIVCGDEVQTGKPSPEIYHTALEKLGGTPETCMVFEDSETGLKASYAAGIRCIFVPDLMEPNEAILEKSWKIFDSHEHVVGFLKSEYLFS